MKAMEDKKNAVIAECERLTKGKKKGETIVIGNCIAIQEGYCQDLFGDDANKDYECTYLQINGKSVAWLWSKSDDWEIDLFYTLLSLGVQPPAPDENGLLQNHPMLRPLDLTNSEEKYPFCPLTNRRFDVELHECNKHHAIVYDNDVMNECEDIGEFDTRELAWQAIEDWRNSELSKHLSHAPIQKDRTNEAIKVCADFAEAVVSGLKEKHQEEVSKLIEALTNLVRAVKLTMPLSRETIHELVEAEKALAAYKEGGEG